MDVIICAISQSSRRPSILPRSLCSASANLDFRMATHLEDSSGDGTIWSQLPQHLVESLLARLPLDCIFRFRSVCKFWKAVLSGKNFSCLWAKLNGGQPCLILCMPSTQMRFLLYSFVSRTWQTLSLSFMPHICRVNYRGSVAGLLLMDIPTYPTTLGSSFPRVCVCNPVSRTSFVLPRMLSVSSVMAKVISGGDEPGTYEVLVVGKTRDGAVVAEAYNSSTESWKMVRGGLPEGLVIRNDEMFVCKGFFFCLTVRDGIVAYHIQEGKSFTIDLPDDKPNIWPRLVACESSIMMVGGIEEKHLLKEVIMWELFHKEGIDHHEFSWKEIGRMPESVCQQFRRDSCSTWFECVGVGEKMCFRVYESLQVVVYSVTNGVWEWLPNCPAAHQHRKHLHLRSLAFEMRPDMKV